MGGRCGRLLSAAYCIIGRFTQALEENAGGLPADLQGLL
jgi:hypothetical protein